MRPNWVVQRCVAYHGVALKESWVGLRSSTTNPTLWVRNTRTLGIAGLNP